MPSGTGANAVRALGTGANAKRGRAQVGPKAKTAEVEEVVKEKADTFLKRKFAGHNGGFVEVQYDLTLSKEDVGLVVLLKEVCHCQHVRLEVVSMCGESVLTLAMLPQAAKRHARLPSILRIGSAEAIEVEAKAIETSQRAFHECAPRVVERVSRGSRGILQLRLSGSRVCLPKNLGSFSQICTFGKLFENIAGFEEEGKVDDKIRSGIRVVDLVFKAMPPHHVPPPLLLEKVNLLDTFTTLEDLAMQHDNFGPEFLDGALAAGGLEEERGGLMSDGIHTQDLIKLVSDACGRPQKPSHFFVDFHQRMTQVSAFWKLATLFRVREHEVHPERILQDSEGRCWTLGGDADGGAAARDAAEAAAAAGRPTPGTPPPGTRPAFAGYAEWLAFGLFLYSRTQSVEDEFMLRRLVMYLAATPESFDSFLPAAMPGEAGNSTKFAWSFAHQAMRHIADNVVGAATKQGHAFERPDLQFFWAMLEACLSMVTSALTRDFPERKRLALFAAIVFASRLWAATGKTPEPKWYMELRNKVKPLEGKSFDPSSAAAKQYILELGSREAWATCPVTGELYTPLEDRVGLEVLSSVDVSPAAEGEEPQFLGGASRPTSTDRNERPREKESEDSAEDLLKTTSLSSLSEVYGLLRSRGRLLLSGTPGSGRSVLLQGLLAHAVQELLDQQSIETLPLRVPMSELAALARSGSADLLQEYTSKRFSETEACALAWESLEAPPFPARHGHQVVAFGGGIWVLGGLGEGSKLLRDAWVSKDLGKTWEEMPQPPWGARYSHQAVAFDGKLIVLAGLEENDKRFRDAWETRDGIVWSELPAAKWPGRGGHRLIVLHMTLGQAPPKDHLVLLGGNASGNSPLQDAWASDNGGFSWTELESCPWPARHSFVAAVFQDKLIVAGGVGEGGKQLQDSWAMCGQIWKAKGEKPLKKGQSAPVDLSKYAHARWEHSSRIAPLPWSSRESFEALEFRGQLVVFGGVNRQGKVQADAWASPDGICWTLLPQAAWGSASGRYGHQAIVVGGRQLVVGGADSQNAVLGDALLSRRLLLAFDNLDNAAAEETAVLNYLDRLLSSEPHHQVLMTTGPTGLDHLKSMHLPNWNFAELEVKPFTDEDLNVFCDRRLADLPQEKAAFAKELFMDPQYKELARTPLLAVLLLHAFNNSEGKALKRCDVYQSIFQLCLQSLDAAKRRDTSEFERLHAQGVDAVAAELALEVQSHGGHVIKERDLARFPAGEAMETFVRLAHAGQLVLFEIVPEGLRFRHHSVQEFLAARQLWRRVNAGEGLPQWIVREGIGSEGASGCGRFFCTLAEQCSTLVPADLGDLKDGLGCILRNVSRVGDQFGVQSLLKMVPNPQPLLTTVDTAGLGLTALHLAASHGHQQVCRTILQLSPDSSVLLAIADGSGLLPMHGAAHNGHEAVVRALLRMTHEKVALIVAVDKSEQKYTALHLAARNGHHHVAQALLELAPCPGALNAAVDKCGCTPLHLAAHNGHEAALRALIARAFDKGILVTTQSTHDRRTALHLAAESGHQSVVRAVLDMAPDRSMLLQMTDKFGQTALHLAAERGHEATIRSLLQAAENDRSALLFARERLTGQTALHLAADCGYGNAVTALLEMAPDKAALVCAVDKCGDTALHLAAEKGRPVAARALLELTADRGALLSMKERFAGQLALHLAASVGHDEVVRVILDLAPNSKQLLAAVDTAGGFTALHLAAEAGHEVAVQALLEKASDREGPLRAVVPRWSEFTPLHLVAYRGHEEVAKVLLQMAPDKRVVLSIKDARGRTPVELAASRFQREVQRIFEDVG